MNKLEHLRKKKNLSQAQTAIKMGLPNPQEARTNISKFESGETDWYFRKVVHYANSVGADLNEIAACLFPEEPYCQKAPTVSEKDMEKIINPVEETVRIDGSFDFDEFEKSTCVIGSSGSGKTSFFIIPAVLNALKKGDNICAALRDNGPLTEKAIREAKENGYEVYVFDSRNMPDTFSLCSKDSADTIADIIMASSGRNDYDYWNSAEKQLLSTLISYIAENNIRTREEMFAAIEAIEIPNINEKVKKQLKNSIATMMHGITKDAPSPTPPFAEKHALFILLDACKVPTVHSLLLKNYIDTLCLSDNENGTLVVIDEAAGFPGINTIFSEKRLKHFRVIQTYASIEQMQAVYKDKWQETVGAFRTMVILGGAISINTSSYIDEELQKHSVLFNVNEINHLTKGDAIIITQGEKPAFTRAEAPFGMLS